MKVIQTSHNRLSPLSRRSTTSEGCPLELLSTDKVILNTFISPSKSASDWRAGKSLQVSYKIMILSSLAAFFLRHRLTSSLTLLPRQGLLWESYRFPIRTALIRSCLPTARGRRVSNAANSRSNAKEKTAANNASDVQNGTTAPARWKIPPPAPFRLLAALRVV